jgi:hypothetical protein
VRTLVAAVIVGALASPAVAGGVVLDMPPPPPPSAVTAAALEDERPQPTVGEVALVRYADRGLPRSDFAWATSFRSWRRGWNGRGWRGGSRLGPWGVGRWGGWWGGGYRISLSPWMFYGERNWQGAYVFPPWLP